LGDLSSRNLHPKFKEEAHVDLCLYFHCPDGYHRSFKLALALGAPLGEYTLGGRFPGRLPGQMRAAALVQILILFVFAFLVVVRAGLAFEQYYPIARIGIWFVVAFFVLGYDSEFIFSQQERKARHGTGECDCIGEYIYGGN
jgi:hypothetical protein